MSFGVEMVRAMRMAGSIKLENLFIKNRGIRPDPRPIDLAQDRSGIGARSIQIIGTTRWYTPDAQVYSYNTMADVVGQILDLRA
jgi:hypothetical protein